MADKISVIYADEASEFLRKAEKSVARRIIKKLEENSSLPNPLLRAKALQGALSGKYRYRIGVYRAVFSYDDNGRIVVLAILKIGHRKDVYK